MVTSNSDNDKLAAVKVQVVGDNTLMPFTRWDFEDRVVIHNPMCGLSRNEKNFQFTCCLTNGEVLDETDSLIYAMRWITKTS